MNPFFGSIKLSLNHILFPRSTSHSLFLNFHPEYPTDFNRFVSHFALGFFFFTFKVSFSPLFFKYFQRPSRSSSLWLKGNLVYGSKNTFPYLR